MGDHKKIDTLKEVIWNLLIYVLYFAYCVVMLLLFHLLTYSILYLNWSMDTIFTFAFIGSTIMMLVRFIRKFVGRN